MYMGRKLLRLEVGIIMYPEIRVEWVVTARVKGIQKNFKIISSNVTLTVTGGVTAWKLTYQIAKMIGKNYVRYLCGGSKL